MSKIHIIVDFQYLYHRHIYSIREGKKTMLSCMVDGVEVDTTRVYYPLKDFEGFRKYWEDTGKEVTVSVCFDSKSERKDEDSDYKSNRANKLGVNDFDEIDKIRQLMVEAGYNVYKEETKEADDLIADLVIRYQDDYDFTVIYTPDSDMMCYLSNKVGLMRYKTGGFGKGMYGDIKSFHTPVTINNFAEYMSNELKCDIRLNNIILYKVTVGDKSDVVKGIKGFGPRAFDMFMAYLDENNVDFTKLDNPDNVEQLLKDNVRYLGEDKLEQALYALSLVRCKPVTVTATAPVREHSLEKREKAYMKYKMKSLID